MNKNFKKGISGIMAVFCVTSMPFMAFCLGGSKKEDMEKKPLKADTPSSLKSLDFEKKIGARSFTSSFLPSNSESSLKEKASEINDDNSKKFLILQIPPGDKILRVSNIYPLIDKYDIIIFESGSIGITFFINVIKKLFEDVNKSIWKKSILPLGYNANKISEGVFGAGYRFVFTNTENNKRIIFNMEIGNCFSKKLKYEYDFKSESLFYNNILRIAVPMDFVDSEILPESILRDNIRFFNVSDRVKNIKKKCFAKANNLVAIKFLGKIESLREEAFSECSKLERVYFSKGVRRVENYAFRGCKLLASITFPEGLEYLGSGVFCGCRSLKSVILPDSLEKISQDAFQGAPDELEIIYKNKNLDKSAFFILHKDKLI